MYASGLVGGDNKNFKHKSSKIRMSSLKLRLIFRPESDIRTFFPPKIRWSPKKKKKKVFTEMETTFSAKIVRFRLVGGMHPEMETDFSKRRLIFRPKSLVLGWWGGCIPPIPPLNPPLMYARIQDLQQRRRDIITVQRILKIMTPAQDYWRQLDRLNVNFLPMRAKVAQMSHQNEVIHHFCSQ